MIQEYLLQNVWLVTLIFGLVYLSDYYVTIYSARLYRRHLKDHIQIEGSFELTPVFQKDVDRLRLLSPAFLIRLLLVLLLIPLIWELSVPILKMPEFYLFATGAVFLRQAAVHLRHVRNIALARLSEKGNGLRGTVEYARWLNLRLSAVELFSFGAFFLLVAAAAGSWFFLGGAVATAWTGFTHWRLAREPAAANNMEDTPA